MGNQTKELDVTGLNGGRVRLKSSELDRLRRRLEGRVLTRGEPGWAEAVRVWNGMVTKKPAFVVQPESATDVAAAVALARDQGLLISVKGGGHNIGGTAIADGGMMLEMSRMRRVRVNPTTRLVEVGPGCRLRDVDAATQQHGLATPLGFISKTGVAGLTLGGGFGYLTRQFGWAADNLQEVEIVTADGKVRRVDRGHDPELFWALRGGGGNFGIVTRFVFRLHRVGPMVTGGLRMWSAEHADDFLDAYRHLTATAPRTLTAVALLRLAPPAPFVPREAHHKPVIGLLLCDFGANTRRDLAALERLPEPLIDLVEARPFAAQQGMLDDMEPDGLCQYWKSEFLPDISPECLSTWRDGSLAVATPDSMSIVFHIEGAHNEREFDDGAIGNRDAKFVTGFAGAWPTDEDGADIIESVRESWRRIRPFSTGGNYVNFQVAEDGEDRTREAYRANFDRLQQVKAQYDPDNLFRVNRNISPRSPTMSESPSVAE